MTTEPPSTTETFGSYLRFLRRRARLTQTELSIAVGYSPGQISMLENGQRHPDPAAVAALFLAALGVEGDREVGGKLVTLAEAALQQARGNTAKQQVVVQQFVVVEEEEIGRLEDVPALPSYAVMRQMPLGQVRAWLDQHGSVAICGLAGMGKSTLAAQIAADYGQRHPVFWMTFNEDASTAPEVILRQLALFVTTHSADPLRLSALSRRPGSGEPTILYAQHAAMILAALADLDAPLLVFDDAHLVNGQRQTLDLIRQLQTTRAVRILFVGRQEIEVPGVLQMTLNGLQRDEVELLCRRLSEKVSADVDKLLAQTGGSPMLLRLAITHLQQSTGDADDTAGGSTGYLVDTILNSLDSSARRLLDLIAIWRGPLDLTDPHLADILSATWTGYDHQAALRHLRRSRVIEQLTQAAPHPLLRDPVVTTVNAQPLLRRQLHQLAAQWALHQDEPVRAAHHLAQGSDLRRAAELVTAQEAEHYQLGEGVITAAVVEEILGLVRARQRSAGDGEWRDLARTLLIQRGDLLINTTRAEDAHASYRDALSLTTRSVDRAQLAEKMAMGFYRRGEMEEALSMCDQATTMLGVGLSQDGVRLRIQIESTRLRVLMTLARFDEARQLCENALALVRPVALLLPKLADTVRAYANLALGYIARFQGNNELARQYLLKSVKHAHDGGVASVEADALSYLSTAQRDLGDFDSSEQTGQRALQLAHAAGNEYLISSILHYLSLADYYHCDLDRALWRTERVLQLKQPMGDIEGIVASRLVQSLVLAAQGEADAALASANSAVNEATLLENGWLRGLADYGVGVILSFTDDLAGAERHLLAALATERLKLDVPFYSSAEVYLGLVYVAQGRLHDAAEILDRPLPYGAGFSTELLHELVRGMWLLAQDRKDEARVCTEALIQRANQYGFLIYNLEGSRLADCIANPPPIHRLPRWVCCGL